MLPPQMLIPAATALQDKTDDHSLSDITHDVMRAQVLMRPYIILQDGHTNPNLWGAIEADRPPTSSPPLDFLRGSVDLRIFNNATQDLAVRAQSPMQGFFRVNDIPLIYWKTRAMS